jgi:hypothetical protein
MFARKSADKLAFTGGVHLIEPSNLALLIALSVAAVLLLALFVPAGHVLPIFSLAALAASVGTGAKAVLTRGRDHVWQIAGMFMLLGSIAGMLSGPEAVLELFGVVPANI